MIFTKLWTKYKVIKRLFVILLFGAFLFTVLNFSVMRIEENFQKDLIKSLDTVLKSTHSSLTTWINRIKSDMYSWSKDSKVVALTGYIETNQDANTQNLAYLQELKKHLSTILYNKRYLSFLVIDLKTKNTIVHSANEKNVSVEQIIQKMPNFWEQLNSGKAAMSLPQYLVSESGVQDDFLSMFAGAPIIEPDTKNIMALLLVRLDPYAHLFEIIKNGDLGETGFTYVFNDEGLLVYPKKDLVNKKHITLTRADKIIADANFNLLHLDCVVSQKNCKKPTKIPAQLTTEKLDKAKNQGYNLKGYSNFLNKHVVSTWFWDPRFKFGLVTEIQVHEAYETLRQIKISQYFMGAILFIAYTVFTITIFVIQERYEEEKYSAKLSRAEKLASLGEMAGALAHEINTPLSAVTLNLDELKYLNTKKDINKELFNEIIDEILDSTQSISKIVKSIKTFSRQKDTDPLMPINIWDVINESASICENNLKFYSIFLKMPKSPSKVMIKGNPSALMQVFINLFNNSKDAIKESDSEPWISIDVKEINNKIQVLFTDSGSGIPKDVRDKIFDPFFTTKEVGQGTGLGLGISYNIIKVHNGDIWVDESCKNTRFVVEFPKLES